MTFPKRPRDLPHGIQFWRHSEALPLGKACHPFGEGLLSPRGPSPSLWPPTALCAISGGEGHATFLRPSPNHPATFPKRTRDLPHGIQLWRNSVAISPGKVCHLFGEGLLSRPPGTIPITSASQGTLCHFWRGRSRHFFETFPKRTRDLPQGIQLWRHSEALPLGKACHPFGEGLLSLRGPSPSLWPPRVLCATSGGEGHGTFLRPSPNVPGTFPTESSSGATQSHFSRGRPATLLGKVSFSPRGPSPSLWPLMAFCAISGGEGPTVLFW